ncbi:MAG TPA: hypothetical protein VLF93_01965 [Candidatus Saccharimonadales bacterium]|nr:hypothetical protein [Candidatus Saccharimonadales bacterium]
MSSLTERFGSFGAHKNALVTIAAGPAVASPLAELPKKFVSTPEVAGSTPAPTPARPERPVTHVFGGPDKGQPNLFGGPDKGTTDTLAPQEEAVNWRAVGTKFKEVSKATAKAVGATAATAAATELAGQLGGSALAAIPREINPVDYIHRPWALLSVMGLSYLPTIKATWRSTNEAVAREDAGEGTFNRLATGGRNFVRRRLPGHPKLETTGAQIGGAASQLGYEGAYWLEAVGAGRLADITHYSSSLPVTASVIIGANLGAAGWLSFQAEASQHLRENGIEPRKGFRGLLDLSKAVIPVAKIKYERNLGRAAKVIEFPGKLKENVVYRGHRGNKAA